MSLALPATAGAQEGATFDGFIDQVEEGRVKSVEFAAERRAADVTLKDGREYRVGIPPDYGSQVVNTLRAERVSVDVKAGSGFGVLFTYLFWALLYGAFWVWLARRLSRIERALSPPQAA